MPIPHEQNEQKAKRPGEQREQVVQVAAMTTRTPIRRLVALFVAIALCFSLSGPHFAAADEAFEESYLLSAASPVSSAPAPAPAPVAPLPVEPPPTTSVATSAVDVLHFVRDSPAQGEMMATEKDARVSDRTTGKASNATNERVRWSIFNLVSSFLNLLIALGLIACLGFSTLREERLEEEAWERLREPQTLSDVHQIAALYWEENERPPRLVAPHRKPTVLSQFCTCVCVGLALMSLIIFFVVGKMNTPPVVFDALSPLFFVFSVLVLLTALCAFLSGRRTTNTPKNAQFGDEQTL
jgi:hypothetical protein